MSKLNDTPRGSRKAPESESEVTQSCPILCTPMDCSLPGSSSNGIFQARILEWVTISFSKVLSKDSGWWFPNGWDDLPTH